MSTHFIDKWITQHNQFLWVRFELYLVHDQRPSVIPWLWLTRKPEINIIGVKIYSNCRLKPLQYYKRTKLLFWNEIRLVLERYIGILTAKIVAIICTLNNETQKYFNIRIAFNNSMCMNIWEREGGSSYQWYMNLLQS